jgi:hypothetical protein
LYFLPCCPSSWSLSQTLSGERKYFKSFLLPGVDFSYILRGKFFARPAPPTRWNFSRNFQRKVGKMYKKSTPDFTNWLLNTANAKKRSKPPFIAKKKLCWSLTTAAWMLEYRICSKWRIFIFLFETVLLFGFLNCSFSQPPCWKNLPLI